MVVKLGTLIKERRQELGLTQKELARQVGMPQPALSDIERGKTQLPNADIRRRIAKNLGVSHLDLLIAAGELTPEEVPSGSPVVERDPETAALIDWVSAIRWTPERISWVRTVLSGMAEMS